MRVGTKAGGRAFQPHGFAALTGEEMSGEESVGEERFVTHTKKSWAERFDAGETTDVFASGEEESDVFESEGEPECRREYARGRSRVSVWRLVVCACRFLRVCEITKGKESGERKKKQEG